MKAKIAECVSTVLSCLAILIITPFSAGFIHQPKAPKELYKK